MTTHAREELSGILEKHRLWLEKEEDGECVGLNHTGLSDFDLSYADLRCANLTAADLSFTNLIGANLYYSNLTGADLTRADLTRAHLTDADLIDANLTGAKLCYSNLSATDLTGACLSYTDLRCADLTGADLSFTDLRSADLTGTKLHNLKSLQNTFGNGKEIKNIEIDRWDVTYTATQLQIGCQLHLINDWWKFTDNQISGMDSDALEWWKEWKPVLQKTLSESPAVGRVESTPSKEPNQCTA